MTHEDNQKITEKEEDTVNEKTETNQLEVEMRTVHIQTNEIQTNDCVDTVECTQSSKNETTEELSESAPNSEKPDHTNNDSSEQ